MTCIGEAVEVEVDGIVATEEEIAEGWHLEVNETRKPPSYPCSKLRPSDPVTDRG